MQALRGSSEFHAWGDSNLYLRREPKRHTLSVEHRGSAAIDDIELVLANHANGAGLTIDERPHPSELAPKPGINERILHAIENASQPLNHHQLRKIVKLRNQVLCERLAVLVREGKLQKSARGYRLTPQHATEHVPVPDSL